MSGRPASSTDIILLAIYHELKAIRLRLHFLAKANKMPVTFHDSHDAAYWERVKKWAKAAKADGCTHVPDFHIECCWQHDRGYQVGSNVDGEVYAGRDEIDAEFRKCMQNRSPLGVLSPMSWWRFWGVRAFGWMPWRDESKGRG